MLYRVVPDVLLVPITSSVCSHPFRVKVIFFLLVGKKTPPTHNHADLCESTLILDTQKPQLFVKYFCN